MQEHMSFLQCLENDWLRSEPQHPPTQLGQLFAALHDGQDVVSAERSGLAGEDGLPVGNQDLGLADPTGIKQDLPRLRDLRIVLGADADLEAA